MTAAPSLSSVLADAGVQRGDAPGTAAALLWQQVADHFEVDTDGPLGPLGVLDRTVLVLLDVAQLTDAEVAAHLNSDIPTIRAAHAAARARVGLPPLRDAECPEWTMVRAAHRFGDPQTLVDILAHVGTCDTCHSAAREHGAVRRWWRERSVAMAAPSAGGVFSVVPAFAATVAVTAAAVAVGSALAPVPAETQLPVPMVVEDDPGLPTDHEPAGGWTSPTQDTSVLVDDDAPTGDGTTDGGAADIDADPVGDLTDDVTDTLDDVTDTVDDVTDTVDDVTDTVDDVVDDVTDTLDDTLDDTVDDVTDTLDDTLEDPVDDVTDPLEDTSSLP